MKGNAKGARDTDFENSDIEFNRVLQGGIYMMSLTGERKEVFFSSNVLSIT